MDDETREILRHMARLLATQELYTERITRKLYEALTPQQQEELGGVDELISAEFKEAEDYWKKQTSMLATRFPGLFPQSNPVPGKNRRQTNGGG